MRATRSCGGRGSPGRKSRPSSRALRGAAFTPEEPPLLWAYVAESLGDSHETTKKVRALSPAALFALADLAWRVWKAGDKEAVRDVVS
jgi:hypothetical protein